MVAMKKNRVRIHDKYRPLFDGIPTRYLLITGGRGSAKSFSVATWACINTTNPKYKQRTLYTRYTLTSAEISIIPEFTEKLDLLGIRPIFHATQKEIINKQTGSDIIFSGIKTSAGNQTARLKSIPGLNVFIVDEAEEFTSEAEFDIIDLSIRQAGMPNLVIIVMNPQDVGHWVWRRWLENSHRHTTIDGVKVPISTHPDVTHIHTTYLDNLRNLPAAYVRQFQKIKAENPAKYANTVIGAFRQQAEGVIFENWREGEFDASLPYAYGLDFGYYPDPTAMVKIAVDERRKIIYLDECLHAHRLGTDAVIEAVRARLERPNDMIVADSAEKRLIADMAGKGRMNVTPAVKGPDSVRAGLRRMLDYEIAVSPESYNLKKELNNYVWNDRKSDTPVDDSNHLIDAARYAFMRLAGRRGAGVKRRN